MDRADWPPLHFRDCIVGRPCRSCAVSDLGLHYDKEAFEHSLASNGVASLWRDPVGKSKSQFKTVQTAWAYLSSEMLFNVAYARSSVSTRL